MASEDAASAGGPSGHRKRIQLLSGNALVVGLAVALVGGLFTLGQPVVAWMVSPRSPQQKSLPAASSPASPSSVLSASPRPTPRAGPSAPVLVPVANPLQDSGGEGAYGVAFSPDGRTLAVGDQNGSAYLWSMPAGDDPVRLRDPNGEQVFGVAFSPDGETLATGFSSSDYSSGGIYLWNVSARKASGPYTGEAHHGIDGVAFSPNGQVVAGADTDDGNINLWDTRTHTLKVYSTPDTHGEGMNAVAFSPDGSTLAGADNNGIVYIWNLKTPARPTQVPVTSNSHALQGIAFSPDGKHLAITDADGNVYLWNTSTHQLSKPLKGPGHGEVAAGVAFGPRGNFLAVTTTMTNTTNARNSVRLWYTATGNPIPPVQHDPESGGAYSLAISPDGGLLAVGDANNHVYLWDVNWRKE